MNNSNPANPTFNIEGKQFLIVEDDPIIRMVMNTMFKKWKNTTIEIVNDGSQALKKLQQSYFDLIIMDLNMPVLNGYQTAKAIREGECGDFYKKIPILAITADLSDVAKTQTEMMDKVLAKPFNFESLESAIHRCLFSEMRFSVDAS